MADDTPERPGGDDEAAAADAPRSPGRRSGLDRLRAARADSGGNAPAETVEVGEGGGRTSREGSTAVLETPVRDAEGGSHDDETAPDGKGVSSPDEGATAADERASAKRRGGLRSKGARVRAMVGTRTRRAEPAPAGGVASGAGAGPSIERRRLVTIVLAVLVVALLIPVVTMRHRIVGQTEDEKALRALVEKRDEALVAGRRFAVTFFSPDYKTIDAYNDEVAALSAGDFNRDFVGKRGELKSLLTRVQSQASGRVLAAGVSRVSGNDVEVLLVADQDVRNLASQGKTVTNRYRVRVTMQKADKGWLVTNLAPVV